MLEMPPRRRITIDGIKLCTLRPIAIAHIT